MRKAIRPIRSRVSCFFTCEPYGKLKISFKAGWRGFVNKPSLCESEESKSFLFAFLPSLILKVPLSTKAMSEKRFVIHDSSVEEYVESLEVMHLSMSSRRWGEAGHKAGF